MPRQNRQKLHKQQRIAAEAAVQARVAERRAQQERASALEAAVQRALRAPKAVEAVAPADDAVLRTITALLDATRVEPEERAKVLALSRVFKLRIPERYVVGTLPMWLLFAQLPWVRPVSTWRSPGGSVRARRDNLAAHLLLRWPVPRFLYRALDVPEALVGRVPDEDAWAVRLFAWVGQGHSPFDAVAEGILPVPLTRRMVNLFLLAKADTTPVEALRRAQVQAQGGSRALADAILASRLAELRGPDPQTGEPFWAEVIAWFCRTPGIDLGELPDTVEYIEARRRRALQAGQVWSITGRTAASVARGMVDWRERVLLGPDPLPRSGLLSLEQDRWRVEELDSIAALQAEGEALHHCVAMYVELIKRRKVSIWGLRHGRDRMATIEVALGAGRVVQAKGACNRGCTPAERGVIQTWAAMNRLVMALR